MITEERIIVHIPPNMLHLLEKDEIIHSMFKFNLEVPISQYVKTLPSKTPKPAQLKLNSRTTHPQHEFGDTNVPNMNNKNREKYIANIRPLVDQIKISEKRGNGNEKYTWPLKGIRRKLLQESIFKCSYP